jgi:peptidyl-prolyl cis-trans isomerase B (cyclophilin B)
MINDSLFFKPLATCLSRTETMLRAMFVVGLLFLTGITMTSDVSAEPITATIHTDKGDMVIDLTPDKTPVTVANFLNLAKRGYYNGIAFHRVIPDFMIQGGDPTGTGAGGPGYKFEDEFNATLKHSGPGILSMANAGAGTNGSQFFITHSTQSHLDNKHTVFGKVTTGVDVVNKIKQGDKIKSIDVTGDTTELFKKTAARLEAWNQILDKKK